MTVRSQRDPSEVPPLVVAEFSALRAEMLQRMGFQHQLFGLCLFGAGTFLTLAGRFPDTAAVLLAYPLLVFFLAAEWRFNDILIFELGLYIKEIIESQWQDDGWERRARSTPFMRIMRILPVRGIFPGTQLLSIVTFFYISSDAHRVEAVAIACVEALIVIGTIVVLRRER